MNCIDFQLKRKKIGIFLRKYLLKQKSAVLLPRRVGRVVDCGGLENRCTERYRGFESLTLRQNIEKLVERLAFLF